jgi:hypothetical protein
VGARGGSHALAPDCQPPSPPGPSPGGEGVAAARRCKGEKTRPLARRARRTRSAARRKAQPPAERESRPHVGSAWRKRGEGATQREEDCVCRRRLQRASGRQRSPALDRPRQRTVLLATLIPTRRTSATSSSRIVALCQRLPSLAAFSAILRSCRSPQAISRTCPHTSTTFEPLRLLGLTRAPKRALSPAETVTLGHSAVRLETLEQRFTVRPALFH